MAETDRYYYLVIGGEALETIKTYIDGVHKFHEHLEALAKKYEAKGWMHQAGCVRGFQFDGDPGFPWKHLRKDFRFYRHDIFAPDSRRKEGKALWKEIREVEHPEFHIKGVGDSWVIRELHMLKPSFERIGDQYILSVPINLDPVKQFIPVGDLQQLKMSEYWKLLEDNPTEGS